MALAARLPHQTAFHSALLPASQSDRAAMGRHAQKRHAQQNLRNLRPIRRCDARFPARKSSPQLGRFLRFGHRQFSRHQPKGFSGHDVNGVYHITLEGCRAMTGAASTESRAFESAEALAQNVAEWLCALMQASDRDFAVCLSGGATPRRLYERLAAPAVASRLPWKRAHWFWGDER